MERENFVVFRCLIRLLEGEICVTLFCILLVHTRMFFCPLRWISSGGSPLNRFLCHGGKMGFNGIHGLWSSSHHPTPRFMAVNDCLGRPTVPDISPAGRPRTTAHLDNLAFAWQCPWGCLTLGVDAHIVLLDGGFMLLGHS